MTTSEWRERAEKAVLELRTLADAIGPDLPTEAFPRSGLRYDLLYAANSVQKCALRVGIPRLVQSEKP